MSGLTPVGFEYPAFLVRITVDTDQIDDVLLIIPPCYLDPQQAREMQLDFQRKKIVILPPGRIIDPKGLDSLPVPD